MKETTIYIEKKLTPEVLEGLDNTKLYFCFSRSGEKYVADTEVIAELNLKTILLPITVTSDMVEKEAKYQLKQKNV